MIIHLISYFEFLRVPTGYSFVFKNSSINRNNNHGNDNR